MLRFLGIALDSKEEAERVQLSDQRQISTDGAGKQESTDKDVVPQDAEVEDNFTLVAPEEVAEVEPEDFTLIAPEEVKEQRQNIIQTDGDEDGIHVDTTHTKKRLDARNKQLEIQKNQKIHDEDEKDEDDIVLIDTRHTLREKKDHERALVRQQKAEEEKAVREKAKAAKKAKKAKKGAKKVLPSFQLPAAAKYFAIAEPENTAQEVLPSFQLPAAAKDVAKHGAKEETKDADVPVQVSEIYATTFSRKNIRKSKSQPDSLIKIRNEGCFSKDRDKGRFSAPR